MAAVFEGGKFSHFLTKGSGPVILDEDDLRFIGATRLTNNTGELSSFIESLTWVMENIPDTVNWTKIIIRPDSLTALRAALGVTRGGANSEMSDTIHTLWKSFKSRWGTKGRYAKVKGHSKDRFNDIADVLAEEGRLNIIGQQGGKWDPSHHDTPSSICDVSRSVARAERLIYISHIQGTIYIDTEITWDNQISVIKEGSWLPFNHVGNPPTFNNLRETLSTSIARILNNSEDVILTVVRIPILILMNPVLPLYEASIQAGTLINQTRALVLSFPSSPRPHPTKISLHIRPVMRLLKIEILTCHTTGGYQPSDQTEPPPTASPDDPNKSPDHHPSPYRPTSPQHGTQKKPPCPLPMSPPLSPAFMTSIDIDIPLEYLVSKYDVDVIIK